MNYHKFKVVSHGAYYTLCYMSMNYHKFKVVVSHGAFYTHI